MESNKFQDALSLYNTNIDQASVEKEIAKIWADHYDENNNVEAYKVMYSCIDLTTLNTTDTRESVWKFTDAVNQFDGSSDIPNVAAICVFPNMVSTVKDCLTADVKIASVSAGFPASQTFTEIKVAETAMALASGADEIDIVLNVGAYLEGSYQEVCEEIMEIKELCRDKELKVILETGALSLSDIMKTSILSLYSGADFLKTSTGKVYSGASPEACYLMCTAVKQYHEKTGNMVGVKVSGGLATVDDAVKYYTIAKTILGEEYMNNQYFRIGASRLAGHLVEAINK